MFTTNNELIYSLFFICYLLLITCMVLFSFREVFMLSVQLYVVSYSLVEQFWFT